MMTTAVGVCCAVHNFGSYGPPNSVTTDIRNSVSAAVTKSRTTECHLTPFSGHVLLKIVMKSVADLLKNKQPKQQPAIKHEFQAYGQRLAQELHDLPKLSLYMKLAKEENRNLLEQAREHVLGSEKVKKPGALFMVKLKQLKEHTTSSASDSTK